MYEVYPTDPKRIRERIRRYERTLEQEQRRGVLGDGYGKRFLLGPLYMLVGDIQGALMSFDWYSQSFPDDGGEPYQYLAWALALWLGNEKMPVVSHCLDLPRANTVAVRMRQAVLALRARGAYNGDL